MLNLTNLGKALQSLEKALQIYSSNTIQMGSCEEELFRDGIIQRFEYSFELSWKTMKRYLEEYRLEKVDQLNNKDFFRLGFEVGLIKNVEAWFDYLKKRNLTSHVYDEDTARLVYSSVEEFYKDAMYLYEQLLAKTK